MPIHRLRTALFARDLQRTRRGQFADRRSDRAPLSKAVLSSLAVRGFREWNRESMARQQHQAATILWHTIVGDLQYAVSDDVPGLHKSGDESAKKRLALICQSGNVLHHHDSRLHLLHEPRHV